MDLTMSEMLAAALVLGGTAVLTIFPVEKIRIIPIQGPQMRSLFCNACLILCKSVFFSRVQNLPDCLI